MTEEERELVSKALNTDPKALEDVIDLEFGITPIDPSRRERARKKWQDMGSPSPLPADETAAIIMRMANGACDVYCANRNKPVHELVFELSKVFLQAIAISLGQKLDSIEVGLGIACAVYFIKTTADRACAC